MLATDNSLYSGWEGSQKDKAVSQWWISACMFPKKGTIGAQPLWNSDIPRLAGGVGELVADSWFLLLFTFCIWIFILLFKNNHNILPLFFLKCFRFSPRQCFSYSGVCVVGSDALMLISYRGTAKHGEVNVRSRGLDSFQCSLWIIKQWGLWAKNYLISKEIRENKNREPCD